ncbi:MAG: hypothetical protein JW996_07035 [Candidatus Cloacimonetes bacterium]|nr:hypothetical protein [Candidatus Cloacimonadota bacterium]
MSLRIGIIIILCGMMFQLASAEELNLQEPYRKYLESKDFEDFIRAAEYYNKYKDVNPQAMLLGSYLFLLEIEKNLAELETSLADLGNSGKFSYANLLLSLGRYQESIEIYNQLNEESPNWSCPWRHKGEAFLKSGDLDAAETALLKSIETRKEHFDAYVMLAEVQKLQGDQETALKTLETGLSYLGKDIEDPAEEVDDDDLKFLHLELLLLNDRTDDYQRLKETYRTDLMDDPRWNRHQ